MLTRKATKHKLTQRPRIVHDSLWARYYGTKHLGKLRGVLMATMVATSSIGPFLVGTCFDSYGSFLPVLGLFAMVPILFAAVSLFVNPPLSTNIKLESH